MNVLINLTNCSDHVTFQVNGETTRVRIVGTSDEPWFCGKDICEVLEYSQPKQALQSNVDDDCKKSLTLLSSELGQRCWPNFLGKNNLTKKYHEGKTVYINEAGLYSLVMSSRAPMAKRFRALVCKEILPAIRKYGTYSINQQLESATKQLEKLSIENKSKDVQIAKQSEKLVKAERKATRITKFMNRVNTKERKDCQKLQIVQFLGKMSGQAKLSQNNHATPLVA